MSKIQHTNVRGTSSNATARRLIASVGVAKHIIDCTIYDDRFTDRSVVRCKANEPLLVGAVFIPAGASFHIINSKFYGYHYVVARHPVTGEMVCSARDERVARMCLAAVQALQVKRLKAVA